MFYLFLTIYWGLLRIIIIYNYPLLDSAKLTIGQMLRRNQNNDEIVQYVLDLRKNGALCRLPVEDNTHREPIIVCSMGMQYEK